MSRKAVVVGGGIGGLSAALALSRQGWRVSVLEQTPDFSETGAGIQISPNASRILHAFGLEASLRACSFYPAAIEMRNWKSGSTVFAKPLGEAVEQRFGAPYLNIHRADLRQVLLDQVRASDLVDLHLDARCVGVDRVSEFAQARVEDGRTFVGHLLVGADGIRSIVRESLFGEQKPRFTGCVAWRGLVPVSSVHGETVPPVAALWMGPGSHFVHYFVRSGSYINFVAVVERKGWEIESWTQRGEKSELIAEFSAWHPMVRSILAGADAEQCYKWALFDRKPLHRWSIDNVTLLGDACHPMLPFMAQGAAQSIEDAGVLAQCLAGDVDVKIALQRYERLRRPRTSAVQQTSWTNKLLYHLPAPLAWCRDLGFPVAAPVVATQINSLFAFDALAMEP